eukprot:3384267-Pleurochrysis_carterae.AAC.1
MIGPCVYLHDDAGVAGAGTAVRTCLLARGAPAPTAALAVTHAPAVHGPLVLSAHAPGAHVGAMRVQATRGSPLASPFGGA